MNPPPPDAPRYLPDIPLPPSTFAPGQPPPPRSAPRGHSFGEPIEQHTPIDVDDWRYSETYLRGVDLFNHGYYWEAHEIWEGLWLACGRSGLTADFLKGLIKLAAAGVKVREGVPEGVRSHAQRATELFQQVQRGLDSPRYLGLNLEEIIRLATAAATEERIGEAPAVGPIFSFVLRLA